MKTNRCRCGGYAVMEIKDQEICVYCDDCGKRVAVEMLPQEKEREAMKRACDRWNELNSTT